MKVLVVEPDDAQRAALARILRDGSADGEFALTEAQGVTDAVAIFQKLHPDLILISCVNIATTGSEICRAVREQENTRHTGIIFIDRRSADDSALSVQCLEMGADDFLRLSCSPQEVMARVRAVLRIKAMTDELRSANHRLRILSFTDELTGLANMRSFNQKFSDAMRHCRKGDLAMGVMMLDLDHFKSVNDTTNHLVGSYVISEVGRGIRQSGIFGDRDVAARYGGDEFIIGAQADDALALKQKAEHLRRLVEGTEFKRDGSTVRITASIGVAWVARGFDGRAEDLIKAADLMLYRSKNLGRNRVSGMHLKYPVDLDHVTRTHLVDEEDAEQLPQPRTGR